MKAFIVVGVFLLSALSISFGQNSNGRVLEPPDPKLCAERAIHDFIPDGTRRGIYYSWRDPQMKGVEYDWLTARNYCRARCMETVSLENSLKNNWIKEKIVKDNVKYIWTSGRLCDFQGCDRVDLQPRRINGWFWTATLQKIAPVNDRSQGDWSNSGGIGKPQPDNREELQNGAPENCVAILNEFYQDGTNWHDVACHHKKPFICEDNESLLNFIRKNYPDLRV